MTITSFKKIFRNKIMRFLVYGGNGWIGSKVVDILVSQGHKVVLGKERCDDIDKLGVEIADVSPDRVICCIGRTHGWIDNKSYPTIDYLEQPGKIRENVRDNLFSPLVLAKLCENLEIHLTYLGTGCIFNGNSEEDEYTEESLPDFFGSGYSVVKGYTDQLMKLFDNVLNVRIRMPISEDESPRNFIKKITSYAKICSIPNSMTVLPELLPLLVDMSINERVGTINLTNPGVISHNEILEMYREIINPGFTWENFSLEEQAKILASARSNNHLNTDKLREWYPNVKDIKSSVRETLILMKKN
jgi:nucleoside-diphosphate-sugar epimerase